MVGVSAGRHLNVQLQHRPLTKDPDWKNNVTSLNERKIERQTLLGVVTADDTEVMQGDEGEEGDEGGRWAIFDTKYSWCWRMMEWRTHDSARHLYSPSVHKDTDVRWMTAGRTRRWGSKLKLLLAVHLADTPILLDEPHLSWVTPRLDASSDTVSVQRLNGEVVWGVIIISIIIKSHPWKCNWNAAARKISVHNLCDDNQRAGLPTSVRLDFH